MKPNPFAYLLALLGLLNASPPVHAVVSYDHGDAPATYGDALHYVPPLPSSFLGTSGPDGETSAQNSVNANGDDILGTDDENAFSALPNLPVTDSSYTLNVSCYGTGTVAGWIDFDQSGTFTNTTPNERASATCAEGSATLIWSRASGNFPASLLVGKTYLRLRTATSESNGICQNRGLFATATNTTGITISGSSSIFSYKDVYDPQSPGNSADVGSNGDIKLSGSVAIEGNVTAKGTVSTSGSVTITGTKTTGAPLASFPSVSACAPYSSGAGIAATGNLKYSAATGDLSLSGSGTMTMAPGSYCFHTVKISGSNSINISGPTTIYLTGEGDFSGSSFVNTTLNADNLRILSSHSAITNANALKLTGSTQMYASVYAPNTGLTISGSANFNGCVVAGTIKFSGSMTFNQDVGLNALGVANPTSTVRDGEVEDYPIAIIDPGTAPAGLACTGLAGDVIEVAAAIPLRIESGTEVFVASRTLSPAEGHLKAYAVTADGSISIDASWDAAGLMNASNRQSSLYSTDETGAKIRFGSLDDTAFLTTNPSVEIVKSYTLNPSYGSGAYLAGRRNGSFLGSVSRGNALALIAKEMNVSRYLDDPEYRPFYAGTISNRSEKVLAASDDGFLYAFDQSDGQLAWGWMPRSLAKALKNYNSFQGNQFMRGKLEVIDVKDDSARYATYVVGSYKNGLGHYALKLDPDAGLDSVVWDEDRSTGFNSAPNQGEANFFSDGLGNTFVAYVATDSGGLSTLIIRNIVGTGKTEVPLDFKATSTPFVMPDFGDTHGPARKTLYLGDTNGDLRRAALLANDGSLNSASVLQTALQNAGYPGALGAEEPILFLAASISALDGRYYLGVQSQNRLTLLKYDSATATWTKRWSSHVGGAGTWDASGTRFTADNGGPPIDRDGNGFATMVSASGIQSLPVGAKITDAAQIAADSVILPVSVTAAGACYGRTYYYFFRLSDGVFPFNRFHTIGGSVISGDLALGYGEPTRAAISDMPSKEQMVGFGGTDQLARGQTALPPPFTINDSISTGLRGWKEIGKN